jgi:hypothetical protein
VSIIRRLIGLRCEDVPCSMIIPVNVRRSIRSGRLAVMHRDGARIAYSLRQASNLRTRTHILLPSTAGMHIGSADASRLRPDKQWRELRAKRLSTNRPDGNLETQMIDLARPCC